MDHERLLLLAVYSKGGALERFAGIREVVQLVMNYTHCDFRIRAWSTRMHTFTQMKNSPSMLEFCLGRLKLPQLTKTEALAAVNILECMQYKRRFEYDDLCEQIVVRMFECLKDQPFSLPLTRLIYKVYGAYHGEGRFARKEIVVWQFEVLEKEGITITRIAHNFEALSADLRSEKGERVQLDLVFINDYPFKAPIVAFTGENRPTLFATRSTIKIEDYFDYGFAGVEEILRTLLVEMNCGGVTKRPDGFSNKVAVGLDKVDHVSGPHRLVADGADGSQIVDLQCAP